MKKVVIISSSLRKHSNSESLAISWRGQRIIRLARSR